MNTTYAALVSIFCNRINLDGKCDDAEICKDIAAYLNMLPKTIYWATDLYDFIIEYGEEVQETYMGRDEDGEKVYHVYNPNTNWLDRIRKELKEMGYYKEQTLVTA